jgi:DNA-binding NtrC family response regulator
MPPIHNSRVLVVDDCSDTASLLCELLALKGYMDVSWVTNARAVCDLHKANPYRVILLDMHMPHLGGLEIMRGLHAMEPDHCVPVIAMSGDSRYRAIAMTAGARGFLLKPFNHEEVEASICDAHGDGDACMAARKGAASEEPAGKVMCNGYPVQRNAGRKMDLPGLLPLFWESDRPSHRGKVIRQGGH